MARILLIDNAKEQRRALMLALQAKGHEVHEAEDGKDGIENLRQRSYELVITEVLLTELDGSEVVTYLDAQAVKPKIIAYTAGNSQIPAEQALLLVKSQVDAALIGPVEETELAALADKLLAA